MRILTSHITLAAVVCFSALASSQTGTAQNAGSRSVTPPVATGWAWPLPGKDGEDWVINNYVDLDPGPGILDYQGGSKSYDGHQGIDIDVPNFRWMDAGFPVRAVADGLVLGLDDSNFDRNTSCGPAPWNYITLLHSDGTTTTYGHLAQGSIVVGHLQTVARGQNLAVVGSSGCSTAPHLHLETRDSTGQVIDPFSERLWQRPPAYDPPLSFMDAVLQKGSINSVDQIKDPVTNVVALEHGDTLGVGLSMAGGDAGSQVRVKLYEPGGALNDEFVVSFGTTYRHTYWYTNFTMANLTGTWTVDVETDGTLSASYPIAVTPVISGAQVARFKIPEALYQAEFDHFLASGYRPIWIDGYEFQGETFFNVVFEQGWDYSWAANHHLTVDQYTTTLNYWNSAGWWPSHVETYLLGGEIRYAALFEASPAPSWALYHDVSVSTHQGLFDSLINQGYIPKEISLLVVNGEYHVTARYDTEPVGGWYAAAGMSHGDYQQTFDDATNAGMTLDYFNAYDDNGVARISAIWNSAPVNGWVARHDLSKAGLDGEHDYWTNYGLILRFVAGYAEGATEYFGAFWSN